MITNPVISIIIPSYNHADYIGETIESLLRQTLGDFELIIVDDGSTDNSPEIIKKYANRDSRIIPIFQDNKGPSAAVNCGLEVARGQFITSHPSDDKSHPNRLEVLSNYLNDHYECDFVGSYIEEIDINGEVVLINQKFESWFNTQIDLDDPLSWIWSNKVASPTLLFRRDFFERYGSYDSNLINTQDWAMLIRSISMGAKLEILPIKLFQYRSHQNNLTNKNYYQTFLEYAYVSSKWLNPWLVSKNLNNAVCLNISSFINHPLYEQLNEIERNSLLAHLFNKINCSFAEFVANFENGKTIKSASFGANSDAGFINLYEYLLKSWLERDAVIAERDAVIAERDAVIAERDARIEELYFIYKTLAWRYTKNFWLLLEKLRSVPILKFRLNKHVLSSSNFKKAFKLIRKGNWSQLFKAFFLQFFSVEHHRQTRWHFGPRKELPVEPLAPNEILISVVIPCFNYGRFVIDAINSILEQTTPNMEVIVVDGGSTDETTVEILKKINFPNVKIFFRDGRHFVGDNRNYGIERASGKYICCLDADDTLEATYIEKALFYLETYAYDIVSTSINYVGAKQGQFSTKKFVTLKEIIESNDILTCAVFRKDLWAKVEGYYDYGIGASHVAEDWDFWVKCLAVGARVRNINQEFLFNYRIHETGSLSSNSAVMSLAEQNDVILASHQSILTKKAFRESEKNAAKSLWINPENNLICQLFSSTRTLQKCIFIVMPYLIVGGVERLLSSFSEYLVGKGWRVVVISTDEQLNESGTSKEWFTQSTAEVYQLPLFLERGEFIDFFNYLIKSRQPDCILNLGSAFLYEHTVSLMENNPTLCFIDWLFNTVGHVDNHIKFKKYFTFAFAENNEVYNWCLTKAGWKETSVRLLKSGVSVNKLIPRNLIGRKLGKLAIADNEIIVGFSGRLSEEKGPDIFVEIANFFAGASNVHFVMTGAGPLEKSVLNQIKKLNPKVKFDYLGLVEDVHDYISCYDLLILPSRNDGRPLVVLEALSLGVPVIASNVGALSELIIDGKNGFIVDSNDAKDFANVIRTIESDRALLSAMKIEARKYAEEHLDGQKAFEAYEAALYDAIRISQEGSHYYQVEFN